MIGITVFCHRLIIFYELKHFENILHMAISKNQVQWHMIMVMTLHDKQYWINQSGESHDFVTRLVDKYVTCTHNA